jgi:hypothetical protein
MAEKSEPQKAQKGTKKTEKHMKEKFLPWYPASLSFCDFLCFSWLKLLR